MTVDLNKHREAFLSESSAHIKTINTALVLFEKNPADEKSFYLIFRAIHTLKSLSATMNYSETADLCHNIEDLLTAIAKKTVSILDCSDLLFRCFDHLKANLEHIAEGKPELASSELIEQVKLAAGGIQTEPINNASDNNPTIERIKSLEIKVEQLDALMNLVEELIINQMHFGALREKIVNPEFGLAVESLGRTITELQYRIMQMRLVPIDFVFNRFLRMTRDLAKSQGKKVNLQIDNSDIELDRVLIDEISESIGHLIRNAIDHGIEPPEEREKLGKPASGIIRLSASRTKDAAIISVFDDGRGLNLAKLKHIALKKGLLKENASQEKIKEVIFSEISTSDTITEVSGRGLGLSIVKQKMQSVNGNVKVESEAGKMTIFHMEVPLTLAIIKALFVKVGQYIYAIPLEYVQRLLTLEKRDFKGLLEREAILYENQEIPIIRLSTLFKTEPINASSGDLSNSAGIRKEPVVIVNKGNRTLGLVVDALQFIQEIIIKPLSPALKMNKHFSGAAVVSSGHLVLILDIAFMLQTKHEEIIRQEAKEIR